MNSSGTKKQKRTPLKQKIKNRRNLSIKQSWDKANLGGKNLTAKNSDFKNNKNRTRQNPSSELTARNSTNQRVVGKHNIDTTMKFMGGTKELMSPQNNILETAESPHSRENNQVSDYYGTYAKVSD